MTTNKILRELAVQAAAEGDTPNIQNIRVLLENIKYSSEFSTLVTVKHVRYGKLSYEVHNFYYIKEYVMDAFKAMAL